MLLFTHHYPETYKLKIPLPQAIWNNFVYVTVNGGNSNDITV